MSDVFTGLLFKWSALFWSFRKRELFPHAHFLLSKGKFTSFKAGHQSRMTHRISVCVFMCILGGGGGQVGGE